MSFSLILLLINLSLFEAMFLPILNLLVSVVKNVQHFETLFFSYYEQLKESQETIVLCCIEIDFFQKKTSLFM